MRLFTRQNFPKKFAGLPNCGTWVNSGETLEFIFFWGHTVSPGKMTKACFSQWYPCDFCVEDVSYHTAEQFMMAQKALLFGDQDTFKKIMAADNPKDYKALGRLVRNFDPKVWDERKFEIVCSGNHAKFSQNPELRAFLLGTGKSVLVEASPYDGIWGVKLALGDPRIWNPNNWDGQNLLGFALMETRDCLKTQTD